MSEIVEAVKMLLSLNVIIWIIVGILLGMIFGAIPGIGATLGMAIVLPFTISLDGLSAFVTLIGIYHGATYGGSITAILINVPGTAASAASTFDGYVFTKKGRAKEALAISAVASAAGGIIAAIVLILVSPILTEFLLLFGTPENFLMTILGIAMISVVSKGSVMKGYISGVFGLMITTVGIGIMSPTVRFTFDYLPLFDGLSFLALLIGLFAVSEMIILEKKGGGIAEDDPEIKGSLVTGVMHVISNYYLTTKSTMIGLAIGAIPGAGASVSNFFAYSESMRASKNPDMYGQGSEEGLIAAESANNGTVGGSLLPTIAFGIPGSTATAVLLGGFIMHGLRPGPSMFTENLDLTFAMFLTLIIGSILILFLGMTIVVKLAKLTFVNSKYLIPIIMVFSVLGVYAVRNNWVDVFTIAVIGFIGYFMIKYNYSVIAFVLGAVLGPIAEENFLRSLLLQNPDGIVFVTRPLSIILILMTIVMLVSPILEKKQAA